LLFGHPRRYTRKTWNFGSAQVELEFMIETESGAEESAAIPTTLSTSHVTQDLGDLRLPG
jgi:hypothetical protein